MDSRKDLAEAIADLKPTLRALPGRLHAPWSGAQEHLPLEGERGLAEGSQASLQHLGIPSDPPAGFL